MCPDGRKIPERRVLELDGDAWPLAEVAPRVLLLGRIVVGGARGCCRGADMSAGLQGKELLNYGNNLDMPGKAVCW